MNVKISSIIKPFSLIIFFFFEICVYSLIYQLTGSTGTIAIINKFIIFVLLSIVIISFLQDMLKIRKSKDEMIMLVSMLYIVVSLLFYSVNMTVSDVMKEFLYTIFPICFFFIGKSLNEKNRKMIVYTIFYSCFIVVVYGVLDIFGLHLIPAVSEIMNKTSILNFKSYFSIICMGYAIQMMFAMVLFEVVKFGRLHSVIRTILLVIFCLLSLLTLQRSSVIGVAFSLFFYFIFGGNWKNIVKYLVLLIVLFLFVYFLLNIDTTKVLGFNFSDLFYREVFDAMDVELVFYDRRNQFVLFNDNNFFNILFGEGFGKYSPNNSNSTLIMPDVAYMRMYNELGIIGTVIFIVPYILMFIKYFKQKNGYKMYFICFTFFAFAFNRILWMIPLNFIIYSMLGIFSARKKVTSYEDDCYIL